LNVEWNRQNVLKAGVAGVILLVALLLIVRTFIGPSVPVNQAAIDERAESGGAHQGNRFESGVFEEN
jgi:hypothetical protein